jgi:hypothetical protein
LIGKAGVRGDLRDDPVAEAVRTELENSIYLAATPNQGPQITVSDFALARTELPSRQFDLDTPQVIASPCENCFRFASVELRTDVPIVPGGILRHGLAGQIADTLWRTLCPDQGGERPIDLYDHFITTSHSVGVWTRRGIAIAFKPANSEDQAGLSLSYIEGLRQNFQRVVELVGDAGSFVAERSKASSEDASARRTAIAKGEHLAARGASIQGAIALPDAELLRRFCDGIGRTAGSATGEQKANRGVRWSDELGRVAGGL